MVTRSIDLWGKRFGNPVWSASGCFGYGFDVADVFDPALLGAVVTKGISREPWAGNPPPRIVETPCGMLNSIGLQNVGLEAFIEEKLPPLKALDTRVVVNFLGHRAEDYVELARRLALCDGVDVLEMNLSCPNVDMGGMSFGQSCTLTHEVVAATKRVCGAVPLVVKLSPNVGDIGEFARAAVDGGADGISVINTLLGMAVDIETRRPLLKRVVGGLSGPAIRPVALRMVWQCHKAVAAPIIGMGGIESGQDVVAFLLAGASAVQVGTAGLRDPLALPRILSEFQQWCDAHGVRDPAELVGALEA